MTYIKSRGCRRQPAEFGPHRKQTVESFNSTSSTTSTHTNQAFKRSDMSIHKYLGYHTEANKSNQIITAEHSCF